MSLIVRLIRQQSCCYMTKWRTQHCAVWIPQKSLNHFWKWVGLLYVVYTVAILPHMVWPLCEFRMQVWKVLNAARLKYRTQKSPKIRHLGTIAQLCRAISSQRRHVSTIGKKPVTSFTCPHNMANFGPLTAEIGSGVWGTPASFNGFRVLAALLHGTLVLGVSQTLRRWTEGATYIRKEAITLGIGPHSSLHCVTCLTYTVNTERCKLTVYIAAN